MAATTTPHTTPERRLSAVDDIPRPQRHLSVAGRLSGAVRAAGRILAGPVLRSVATALIRLRSFALQAAGLGLIAYGLWHVHPVAGYIAAGVALLLLEYVLRSDR